MGQLNSQDAEVAAALSVIDMLRANGHVAYLVGGCVRDRLMGRVPEDYDVATSARPGDVMRLFPRTVAVGAKFGVVLVVMGDVHIEVATFRCDLGYSDRRRPDQVEFSDPKHDAERRDFTVNALFFDPAEERVIDFVGGQEDLSSRVIRAVGVPEQRFQEDALRLMRAVRFASTLDFRIDAATWSAICSNASLIRSVSAERIRDELIRGLTRPHADRFLVLLLDSRLMHVILPEIAALKGCLQPPEFHPEGDVFEHTRRMLTLLPPEPSPALALAVLFHDVGKPSTAVVSDRIRFNNHHRVGAQLVERIARRLALPNDLRDKVATMVLRHMDFMNLHHMKKSTLHRFLSQPHIAEEIELHRLDCLASHGDTSHVILAQEKLKELKESETGPALPEPLITGNDLIAIGLTPGPIFKAILGAALDAQIEGAISNHEQGIEFVRDLLRENRLCD